MPVSKQEEKMYNLQCQMRENQTDLSSFLGDLDKWTEEIKEKDESLQKQKDIPTQQVLPPVRNSQDRKKTRKKKRKETKDEDKDKNGGQKKRISGYDYRGWDKFDVDAACDEVEENKNESSEEEETDSDSSTEEWTKIQLQQQAIEEKNKGNEYFNKGDYEMAIESYTKGMHSDPSNALLPGNRAMALIKLQRFGAAEVDATQAITLDPLYFKAYLRRATAKIGLKKYESARDDYKRLLAIDPGNKVAKNELAKLEKELDRGIKDRAPVSNIDIQEEGIVKPIYKPPEQRSKKPMKRIEIQEIGVEEDTSRKSAVDKIKTTQSVKTREIIAKNDEKFEQFTSKQNTDSVNLKPMKSTKLKIEEVSSNDTSDLKVKRSSKMKIEEVSSNNTSDLKIKKSSKMKIEEVSPEKPAESELKLDLGPDITPSLQKSTKLKIEEISSSDVFETSTENKSKISPRDKPVKPQTLSNPSSPRSVDLVDSAKQRKLPITSFQFQSDYKELKNNMEAFYQYFQRIKPSTYPKLFGESLDSDILLNIFTVLHKFFIMNKENCYEHVRCLAQVKRFSMTIMFMSKQEKIGIQEVFKYLQTNQMADKEDLQKLLKIYQL